MVRAAGIEGISISFSIGVFMALTLGASVPLAVTSSLAVASAFLFTVRSKNSWSVPVLFLVTGIFSCQCSSLSFGSPSRIAESFARPALARLCALIDSIDFDSFLDSGNSERNAMLVKALLTGVREDMDPGMAEAFRQSGASHILALSGLHLGVIYLLISRLLLCLGSSQRSCRIRAGLCIALCGLYTLVTGAGPSIVRAFLFICLNEMAKLHRDRKRIPSKILCTALLVQLGLNPRVMTSVGFQLSYLAMCGICFLFPVMEKWSTLKLWKMSALSISCQLFTFPLVLLRFGTFPKYFLLTNLIAMPLSEALIVTSVLATALAALGMCPLFLSTLAGTLADLMVRCLEIISSM